MAICLEMLTKTPKGLLFELFSSWLKLIYQDLHLSWFFGTEFSGAIKSDVPQ